MSNPEHFDTEASLDPVRGYPERDLDWFRTYIFPDLRHLKEELDLGKTLLDVGCASGYFTREYAALFPLVMGIDFSWKRIGDATSYHQAGLNVKYMRADITDPQLPVYGGFHTAISSAVFQHIPPDKRKQAFANVRQAIIPNDGHLILYDALRGESHRSEDHADADWDGYTELLSLDFLVGLEDFAMIYGGSMNPCEYVATDGAGYRINRIVLSAI